MPLTPVYTDDLLTLYHGDALAVLRELPAASVDAVITDPPYSSGGMVRGDRASATTGSKYTTSGVEGAADFSGDNRDQRGYAYWCALWLSECLRVAKAGAPCLLFTDWRQLPATTDALQAGGWVWRGIVPWYKPASRPMLGRFTAACEYVVWGTSGPRPIEGEALPGFLQATPPRDREHITQKPLSLMHELIRIAPADGVILDPFAGSGTTLAAAKATGRRAIGIEINDHFAETMQRRAENSTHEPSLFDG